jgi:hypothetical protein
MTPRVATFLMFVVNGAIVGTWVADIPGTKSALGASGADFGLALLCAPVGALVAQQVTGQLLVRMSSQRILTVSSLLFPFLLLLPVLAPSLLLLALALFVFGYVNTTMDVTMNAHGVAIEVRGGNSIFSGLHAGWSLGGGLGAVAVAIALALGIAPVTEALVAAAVMWFVVVVTIPHLGEGTIRTEGAAGVHLPSRAILPLAGLIMLMAFVEGGLTDWGGVYMDQGVHAERALAALAYASLSLGLFLGRIGGDRAKDAVGSVRLMQGGMLLTAAAVALVLIVGEPWVALLGMVVAGLGVANTIPQVFGAAGRIPPAGPSLSAVFTALTVAFIASPAIIGTSSDLVGISTSFWLLVASSLAVTLLVGRVPAAETNPRFRRMVPVAAES